MSDHMFAAPIVSSEGREFWDAASQGRLVIKSCLDCGKSYWYPRALCPACLYANTQWKDATGKGTIYSFTIIRIAAPYVLAMVTLDEGVTMLTNIVDAEPDAIHIGARVQVEFRPSEGGPPVPTFKLDA
jgi:uncharacterized OB-fold protein